ncbi:MAG: nitroreductase family protein [Flammeovirgaceae bacterium]|nr:nitroreductase family protein [Flammeovirgaceae bacterium]
MSKNNDYLKGLGANERAILERIPLLYLRKFAAGLVRAKERVQFTGWLQYLLPLIPILILSLLTLFSLLIKNIFMAKFFGGLGGLVLLIALFDIVTVKFKIRPSEQLPHPIKKSNIFDLIRTRHSCRSFQTRLLTKAHRANLMDSVQTHLAEQQIGTTKIRFEYIAAPLTVWPTVNASEFFVAITPKEYDRIAIIDVGRSLQKVVIDATSLNLGTCWIGPGADHASIIENLGERFEPEKDQIICVLAVGYISKYIPMFIRLFNSRMSTTRLPISKLFFTNATFKNPLNIDALPFKKFGRSYEMCQWAPSSYNGQTTRCAAVTDKNGTPQGFDFYTATSSRYYAPLALGIWAANWELSTTALGLDGHFTVHPQEKKERLPRYDLSWVKSP